MLDNQLKQSCLSGLLSFEAHELSDQRLENTCKLVDQWDQGLNGYLHITYQVNYQHCYFKASKAL